jgi:putative transposase
MDIRFSAHGAYHHQYHLVWIPKYRRRVLTDEVKAYVEQHLRDIEKYHPEVEIQEHSVQADHVHMVAVIPPKYSVSSIVGAPSAAWRFS